MIAPRRFSGLPMLLIAALLATSLIPVASGRAADSYVVALPSPTQLDTLLTTTRAPTRDLYALAARLKLHITTPIDHYVNHTPTDYPVGRTDTFYVSNLDTNGYKVQPATLVYKTTHLYMYVQHGITVNTQMLIHAANVFEQKTYPTDHALFGMEWAPGVDDDMHITVFNGQIAPSAAGFFSYEDNYPRSVVAFSNQRKMVYMNLANTQPGTSYYDSVLAHEFQHMIHWNMHPADEGWINEGSSVLAQELNGYSADGFDQIKAGSPDTQLDTFINSDGAEYGGGYLWMLYLYEHFGGALATRAVLSDRGISNMALFDDVLAKLGSKERADDLFADWVIANFLNDRTLDGGRYGYIHSSIHSVTSASVTLPFKHTITMHQYAANYIDIPITGKPFTLNFSGAPSVSLLDTVPPTPGFWWSNRADNVDTSLTLPPLDLRSTHHATLHYQIWWDLEPDYDYGYVEVSSNGGKTWYSQPTAHTTDTDPNSANYGHGYTASSCSRTSAAQHCWVNESVDLSRYAGKRILVRFEQVTDDEVNRQGMAVTHIQVPEIGFDGNSTAQGWQSAGWIRGGNTLAEHWIVQAIEYRTGAPASVVRVPVAADGHGTLRIPAGTRRVVVVVSPTAPLTTVENSYTLSAAP